MSKSTKLQWPYPNVGQDPWFDVFESMVGAMDYSAYAFTEDRHIRSLEGGIFSFSSSTNVLSWTGTIEFLAAVTGFRWTVVAGSTSLQEGEILYLDLVRGPIADTALSFKKSYRIPLSDNSILFCVRRNNRIYFRDGQVLLSGAPSELFSKPASTVRWVIPNPTQVTGTTETYVGSVYLRSGTIFVLKTLLGSQIPADAASLRLRRNTGSVLVTTVGGTAGLMTSRQVTNITISADDWYDFTLFSDNPVGIAVCGGISIEMS